MITAEEGGKQRWCIKYAFHPVTQRKRGELFLYASRGKGSNLSAEAVSSLLAKNSLPSEFSSL